MDAHSVVEVIGWVIVASVVVAVITNAQEILPVLKVASNAGVSESLVLSGNAKQVSAGRLG